MIPRKYGKIINVASIAGLSGNGPNTMQTIAYNTSKGAVVNFTRTLAGEWGRFNITVNAVAPAAQARIRAAGDAWLSRQPDAHRLSQRYDIVAVLPLRLPRHFPDAF